jgi:tRNA1(Val) A37 N6-methylase TrmN6
MKKHLEPNPIAGSDLDKPLPADVTDDAFLGGRLQLLQPRHGYRAGIDAVLLAAAVEAAQEATAHLLDVGAGVGAVGLCAARRISTLRVTLMEREPELCRIAIENIRRNTLEDRVRCVTGAVGAPSGQLTAAGFADESFTHVVANPPFMAPGAGTSSKSYLKAASHGLQDGQSFDDWARFFARMLRPDGTVILIHKADALTEVLAGLQGRFGALTVLPLHPRAGEPANRIIVKAIKGRRTRLTLLPGLILHGDGNTFTPLVDSVLRHAAALKTTH